MIFDNKPKYYTPRTSQRDCQLVRYGWTDISDNDSHGDRSQWNRHPEAWDGDVINNASYDELQQRRRQHFDWHVARANRSRVWPTLHQTTTDVKPISTHMHGRLKLQLLDKNVQADTYFTT